MRPHTRQPTRLPRPWDSPGKSTGVGCHFLLQCMKVKSEREVAQSCPTLRDPMDCSLPGSPVPGIFQAGVLEWGAIVCLCLFNDSDNKTHTHTHTHTNNRISKHIQRKQFMVFFFFLTISLGKGGLTSVLKDENLFTQILLENNCCNSKS